MMPGEKSSLKANELFFFINVDGTAGSLLGLGWLCDLRSLWPSGGEKWEEEVGDFQRDSATAAAN